MNVPSANLRSTVVRFRGREDGTVAITFGIALLPMVVALGAGIDYGRATTELATLQQGTDAAALAGIQAIRKGQTVLQATPLIQQVVATNDTSPNASVTNVNLSSDGTTLCVTTKSSVPTTLMGVAGYTTMGVSANGCSASELATYEIAFAFDNSASMADSAQSGNQTKMQAAQQAAKSLMTTLAGTNGSGVNASYSVTPFSSSVNVGPSNQGAPWLDNAGQSSIHWKSFSYVPPQAQGYSLFTVLGLMGVPWGGCVEERPAPYTTSDDTPTTAKPDTLFAPFFSPDETDNNPNGPNYNQLTFNNYVGDTSGSCQPGDAYAVADQKYGRGDGQTKLCKYTSKAPATQNQYYVTQQGAGPNAGCATTAMTTLTATASTVTTAINLMSPIGDTALAPGFMWAWRSISPKGPFANTGVQNATSGPVQPRQYGYVNPTTTAVNHKVIILLTDGENDWFGQNNDGFTNYTQFDPNKMVYNAFGYPQEGRLTGGNATGTTPSTARQLLDQTTLNACTAAKATVDPNGNPAPVEIYTVGFLATDGIDQQGQSLLANCATDSSHAFLASNGDQLVAAFQQIAAQITQPRIAK